MRGGRFPLPIGSAPAPATESRSSVPGKSDGPTAGLACLGLESVAGRSASEPTGTWCQGDTYGSIAL